MIKIEVLISSHADGVMRVSRILNHDDPTGKESALACEILEANTRVMERFLKADARAFRRTEFDKADEELLERIRDMHEKPRNDWPDRTGGKF
jgi:hypothetical protein